MSGPDGVLLRTENVARSFGRLLSIFTATFAEACP